MPVRRKRTEVDYARKEIIAAASRRFRRQGIEPSTLAAVMNDVGMTHGAFYGYFASKEDLLLSTLQAGVNDYSIGTQPMVEDVDGALENVIGFFLSPTLSDDPGQTPIEACLAPEITRLPLEIRKAFEKGVFERVASIAQILDGRSPQERRRRAMSMLSSMIGTLQLARLVTDPELSLEILATGADNARSIAKGGFVKVF